jgi:hypothetical protein
LLAISQDKPNKAPGPDGVCLEFYKAAWDVIKLDFLCVINDMYLDGAIMAK